MGRPAVVALADWTEQAINVIEKLARSQSMVTALISHLVHHFAPVVVVVAGYSLLLAIAAHFSRRDQ